ncbi:hypothetical protein LA080_000018 [Diaporthe eres]|nr:hypothetical protein LA080_000018 [Diaporthe eres]
MLVMVIIAICLQYLRNPLAERMHHAEGLSLLHLRMSEGGKLSIASTREKRSGLHPIQESLGPTVMKATLLVSSRLGIMALSAARRSDRCMAILVGRPERSVSNFHFMCVAGRGKGARHKAQGVLVGLAWTDFSWMIFKKVHVMCNSHTRLLACDCSHRFTGSADMELRSSLLLLCLDEIDWAHLSESMTTSGLYSAEAGVL